MNQIFNIKINGTKINEIVPIYNIETYNRINKIPYCIIKIYELTNVKNELFIDNKIFDIGANVTIEADDQKENLDTIFNGYITNISLKINKEIDSNFLELKCCPKAHQMNIAKKTRSFINKTDAEIIKSIISQYGLTSNIEDLSTKHEFIYQNDLTDWEFINIRANIYGAIIVVDGDKITISKPQKKNSNIEIDINNIISTNIELDGNSQISEVETKIFDTKTQTIKEIRSDLKKENSFGSKKSTDIISKTGNQINILKNTYTNETETKKIANEIINLNRFCKIHGNITIPIATKLQPNTTINIKNCSNIFTGESYVNGIQHIYNEENRCWLTKIHIGLNNKILNDYTTIPNNKITSNITNLQYGKVIKICDDPESIYRIFVTLPAINDKTEEGIWCRLSTLYASQTGGILFMPEKDDEVIIGFIGEDTNNAIILGSLYNSKNKPATEIKAENYTKSIKTNTGLEINFNDQDKIIELKTGDKRNVIISEKDEEIKINNDTENITISKGSITIKADKEISLDCKNINISASSNINIKSNNTTNIESNNVKIKGNMGTSINGSTSTKIESSGITEVKGSIVKIN